MPAPFESSHLKFLYPDNWKLLERSEEEGTDGLTLELPTGGFFSLELEREGQLEDEVIEEVFDSIQKDYGDVEREESEDDVPMGERLIDFRFFYLDLVIVSRLMILKVGDATYILQLQAESRDFEANELVLAAILKQIREA
ncbi:MAG: hypothetical protein AB8B91_09850 [Rubripirellula sp.]